VPAGAQERYARSRTEYPRSSRKARKKEEEEEEEEEEDSRARSQYPIAAGPLSPSSERKASSSLARSRALFHLQLALLFISSEQVSLGQLCAACRMHPFLNATKKNS